MLISLLAHGFPRLLHSIGFTIPMIILIAVVGFGLLVWHQETRD